MRNSNNQTSVFEVFTVCKNKTRALWLKAIIFCSKVNHLNFTVVNL